MSFSTIQTKRVSTDSFLFALSQDTYVWVNKLLESMFIYQ